MRYLSLWPEQQPLARDFWQQFDDIVHSFADSKGPRGLTAFSPSLDIEEKRDQYVFKFDIPGLKQEEIAVEVRDNTLYVSGERKREEKTDGPEKGEWTRVERFHGRFERAVALPRDVGSDKIEAHYADGVLEISIPKTETALARKIEVKPKMLKS